MCGVGTVPSKRLFQIFTALVGLVTLQWQRLCVGLMGGFIGIFIFIVHLRIGRKILLIGLLTLFTLRKCGKLALIRGFDVRSFYLSFYPPTLSFPWRLVWQSKVPLGVAFFSWIASLGKILTTDNLRKRRIIVLD